MAVRIFPWGTIRGGTNSMVLGFAGGRRFELPFADADWVAHKFSALGAPSYKWEFNDPNSGFVLLMWEPSMTRPTAKSIFKIGFRGPGVSGFSPGTTPVILDHDEATELAGAIRSVAGPVQTAKAAP